MAPDKPLLSVLVAAYNAEKYVAQALKSLLLQTYPNLEILVCDDCSTDRTASIIETFRDPRIRFFRNASNLGKNKTCADLLTHTNGTYISVHDADDISVPERFSKQMEWLTIHPDYVMCGTNFISFLDNGTIIGRSALATDIEDIRTGLRRESQFHGPTIVFKKEILDQVGGFYRYFTRAEDIDLTMRIAEKYKATNLTEHLYLYRHVSTSLTNDINGYSIERWGHAKLLHYLSDERRRNNGVDSLMRGDLDHVNAMMEIFTTEFRQDPTMALRKGVFRLLGMKMYGNAVRLSLKCLLERFTMLNLKCVVYAILAALKGALNFIKAKEKVDLTFFQRTINGKV